MNPELQDRIEDYLDGALDNEAARRFEQDLLQEEVAAEFREALLLRELLGSLPPEQPPQGLVERIESAMIRQRRKPGYQADTPPKGRIEGLSETIKAGLRWPGRTLTGLMGGPAALKGSTSGMRTIGYALGPLREPARTSLQSVRLPRIQLWKMALSRAWRGVSS